MTADPFMDAAKPRFERSATALLGPADPDHYRVQVGEFHDRWYCDPLPSDDAWPATEWMGPSISTVKRASGSDWSYVAMKRVAEHFERLPNTFDGMTYELRLATLNSINKTGLSAAAKRGTNVHLYCEAKLHGSDWKIPDGAPGHEYMPAVDAWFDQHQPELVAAEYVVIDRDLHGVGYGGTPDGLIKIGGDLYAIDWKTRGADSKHSAYPEEAEQIAAGYNGQYMIVAGPNGPERQPIPTVAGGLVISIKPDGCRTYPINLEHAYLHWEARHAWWCARRTEREPIGRQWPVKKAEKAAKAKPAPTVEQRTQNLRERCGFLSDGHSAAKQHLTERFGAERISLRDPNLDHTTLDAAEQIVQEVEKVLSATFNDWTESA
jgi:hypothetical protein